MAFVVRLTFNPFQENTFLVYDDTGACAVFDPGCYTSAEQAELDRRIETLGLRPARLINTHCHIDHVFGNAHVAEKYDLPLEIHRGELPVLQSVPQQAFLFGTPMRDRSPAPGRFLEAGETVTFGETALRILFTPGHSPASLSFFCEQDRFVIAGDVLFQGSIGRTDLPGGDFDTLIDSIRRELFPLGDDVVVYCGHGPETTIGAERRSNPFLR
jgi:glyoxylase-like metal-dependent hydrolase (beta-lactamase superfamily II)